MVVRGWGWEQKGHVQGWGEISQSSGERKQREGKREEGFLSSVVSGSAKAGRVAVSMLADSTASDNRWYSIDINTSAC